MNSGRLSADVGLIEDLEFLSSALRSAKPTDDHAFGELLQQTVMLLGYTHQDVAEKLLVSRPTVTRWLNHTNLPHPAMRSAIFAWAESDVASRLLQLKRSRRDTNPTRAEPHAAAGGW